MVGRLFELSIWFSMSWLVPMLDEPALNVASLEQIAKWLLPVSATSDRSLVWMYVCVCPEVGY